MPRWSNWSGRLQAKPREVRFLRSEDDARALLRDAAAKGLGVRAAGAGHSHAALVPSDGVIVDTSGLAGVIGTDSAACTARIWAGTPIYALGRPLHDAGLALHNQGDIDRQSLAGACATGTHGTGVALTSLSARVVAARLVLADGEIVECRRDEHEELWQAARLHLGALGLVTQLELALRPAYRLRERGWRAPWEELAPQLEALPAASRHFEFFWHPEEDVAVAKAIDETNDPPGYPLAAEGRRVGWSYEVLPNHRPHLHTEMEYSVPAQHGPACMAAIRDLVRRQFPGMRWPVEYRTLAADDVWLSSAFERPTVTISVHQDVREDDEPYFRACEEIFLDYDGRPHWGKVHYLDGDRLVRLHPCWERWWRVRDELDPAGIFMNEHLRRLRG